MFDVKIVPDDQEAFDLTVTARDIAVWERNTPKASFAMLQQQMRMDDVYSVAYYAAKRKGLFNGTLQDFKETCDIVFKEEQDTEPANPFPKEA